MNVNKYSEADKEKYVRGFKSSTLELGEYARKMKIEPEELKRMAKNKKILISIWSNRAKYRARKDGKKSSS